MKKLNLRGGVWHYDESSPLGDPGGFAAVYPGQSAEGTPAAVKIFHSNKRLDAGRELEFALSRIGKASSHVIAIYDCGIDTTTEQPAIVMARGSYSLAAYSKAEGALPEATACAIAKQIVDGLLEVSDWVHRDLKPANVIWCNDRWQIVDFGIARIADASTASATMKGFLSPHYAAPEQWDNGHADHSTDVYALGCILYELLTGRKLFIGDHLASQHRSKAPEIAAGSPVLQAFLRRMVAKPMAARPSLEQVEKRLRSLSQITGSANRTASALAVVSAEVSAQQSEKEAADVRAKEAARIRVEMREHALGILTEIRAALFERIQEEAPAAEIRESGGAKTSTMEASLGKGVLRMSVGHMRDVQPQLFPNSGWDVICWDTIRCSTAGYERSASLWFVNDGSGSWRWLEASYYSWSRLANDEPFSLPPGADADLAASKIMHSWGFAHPPRPIEDEDQTAFIDRWVSHLAQAAQGRLAKPSRLPED